MSSADRRAASKEMRDATKERAKIVRDMNLDASPVDPWTIVDAKTTKVTTLDED
jgi:hypothetical protein